MDDILGAEAARQAVTDSLVGGPMHLIAAGGQACSCMCVHTAG